MLFEQPKTMNHLRDDIRSAIIDWGTRGVPACTLIASVAAELVVLVQASFIEGIGVARQDEVFEILIGEMREMLARLQAERADLQ